MEDPRDSEAEGYRKFREGIKTEFTLFAEKISEDALAGELIGMVTVLMSPDGSLHVAQLGIRGTEAIGMLEIGGELLKRKLLA